MAKLKLSLYQKQQIEMMFFGPYDNVWLDERGRIDNSDETISARTQLPLQFIITFINLLVERRNKLGKPIFYDYIEFRDHAIIILESKINEEIIQEKHNCEFDNIYLLGDDLMVSGILSLPT